MDPTKRFCSVFPYRTFLAIYFYYLLRHSLLPFWLLKSFDLVDCKSYATPTNSTNQTGRDEGKWRGTCELCKAALLWYSGSIDRDPIHRRLCFQIFGWRFGQYSCWELSIQQLRPGIRTGEHFAEHDHLQQFADLTIIRCFFLQVYVAQAKIFRSRSMSVILNASLERLKSAILFAHSLMGPDRGNRSS